MIVGKYNVSIDRLKFVCVGLGGGVGGGGKQRWDRLSDWEPFTMNV